ncbi:uncharacterized mitochondrial protein AtMg00810-like [Macadamia integrifolia]|uniref:uncharacterized mitochondrial protein AtMg00810-like n=1 Tax=Macadamia integrifolia TaxID=60698 RepID=UPI001C4F86AC|nr:uncharacterized mitochondrial protein AtMg00810-like [Macadamia integrifolia]
MSLNLALQDLSQKSDEFVTSLMKRAKSLSDDLATAGSTLKQTDHCLHILRVLRKDLHDIVPTLLTRSKPLAYSDLLGVLLSYEFMNQAFARPTSGIDPPPSTDSPSVNTAQHDTSSTSPSSQSGKSGRGCGGRGGRFHPQGNSSAQVTALITKLATEFSIKDLGPLGFFLGIEAVPQPNGGAPFDDPTCYRSIGGALQYMTLTCPDVAFTVNRACQYMHAPTMDHWSHVKRILRYLKQSCSHGLLVECSSKATLQAFSDADLAGSSSDHRSTGAYAIYLGPNLISWSSRKQKTVARSSTKAEYKGLADASTELIRLESLFQELSFLIQGPPIL